MARAITKKATPAKKRQASAPESAEKKPLPRSRDEYSIIAERLECLLRLEGRFIARDAPECGEAVKSFWNGLHGPTIIDGRSISHDVPPMPSTEELRQAAEVLRFVAGALADPQPRMHIVAKMYAEVCKTKPALIGRFVQTAFETIESYRKGPHPAVIESFLGGVAALDPRLAALYERTREARCEARGRGELAPPLPDELAWLTQLFDGTLRKKKAIEASGLAAQVASKVGAFGAQKSKSMTMDRFTNRYRLMWNRWLKSGRP